MSHGTGRPCRTARAIHGYRDPVFSGAILLDLGQGDLMDARRAIVTRSNFLAGARWDIGSFEELVRLWMSAFLGSFSGCVPDGDE